jgi:hypothetical protein
MGAHPVVQRGVGALGSSKLHRAAIHLMGKVGLPPQTRGDDQLAGLVPGARRQITFAPLQSAHFFNQDALGFTFRAFPTQLPRVVLTQIRAKQPAHPRNQIRVGCLHRQMKVILHWAVRMDLPTGFRACPSEGLEKVLAIHVIEKNVFSAIASVAGQNTNH